MRNDKQKSSIRRPNVRSLKIQPKTRFNKYSQKNVPEIKLCGDWLQHLGFQLGARVTVTSMPNLLIIRTTE
ncbi:MAG: SymE family type I addiction module toxin [Cyclobacteriaceae bacterium]|nr:SymE family type I addiction module toxin [Cyclobacteriaceae bacterium]